MKDEQAKQYRQLEAGEKVMGGDEFNHGDPPIYDRWREVWNTIGMIPEEKWRPFYRRPING